MKQNSINIDTGEKRGKKSSAIILTPSRKQKCGGLSLYWNVFLYFRRIVLSETKLNQDFYLGKGITVLWTIIQFNYLGYYVLFIGYAYN